MGPGRLFWKLFFGNAILMAAALGTLVWLIVGAVDRSRSDELTEHLKAQATILRQATSDRFDAAHAAELERFVRSLTSAPASDVRYTLIAADGTVLAESEADPASMGSHAHRKEVIEALADGWGEDTRLSQTLSQETRYVAVRVGDARAPVGVVRVAMPVRTILEHAHTADRFIWEIGLVGLAAVVVLALALARMWSNPIRRITMTARSVSRGDLTARVPVTGSDELALLARSLNEMRDRLAIHLETIDRQRRTLESLLAQLNEGVVVAGPDGRIVLINPAALRLLGIAPPSAGAGRPVEGLAVEQCISRHELQRMLLTRSSPPAAHAAPTTIDANGETDLCETRLQVDGPTGAVSLLARASDIVLPGPSSPPLADRPVTGRLLVLTDVTELTRMIQVKADFAANASHELRTPLSAIRAAVETLMQVDPAQDADIAKDFLAVIDRHSERMQAMVADLLDLSRLESASRQFEPASINLREVLNDLRTRFDEKVRARRLHWEAEVPDALSSVVVNPYLLRLVLDNLVDNAIKFTDPGGQVRVACRRIDGEPNAPSHIAIEVSDTGCGIPEAEQNRVFERFYQVERARSGSLRGTGLGLSIVRHAVAAMHGTIRLQSCLGQGTGVTIILPQPA